MGRRRNKLRNAADIIGVSFLDMNTELLKLGILVAELDLKISFYMQKFSFFSALPFSASAPSLRLLWRRHWLAAGLQC